MNKSDPPRKALGKGLHSLIPARKPVYDTHEGESVKFVPINDLKPNLNQPRLEFDEEALAGLTQSILRDGIIQPLIVRKWGPEEYQIIAGERRWRAARAARLAEVPVIVRDVDDQKIRELALIENIQREDLNPIELAMAFETMAEELGITHEEIGQRTGKERVTITNAVRLLQLPRDIQKLIVEKKLSAGHARALLKLDGEALQREIAERCVSEGWSVRQIEEFTRSGTVVGARKSRGKKEPPAVDPNVKFAIDEMERVLGTRVRITEKGPNKGQIEIEYYSQEDLDRVYELILRQ